MKYRKKPVVIEAWPVANLLKAAESRWDQLPQPVVLAYENGEIVFTPEFMSVHTLEGVHRAERTDMLICGVKGELYPCKPDIFAATYEAVE